MIMTTGIAAAADLDLLPAVVDVTTAAGRRLLAGFAPGARPARRAGLLAAVRRNEELASAELGPALAALRPGAGWVADGQEATPLPPGEWWAVDAVEGNVNHVHGLPEWCVNVTLLRDRQPVLTVVHQPVGDLTWTAVRGAGAHRNGAPLRVSAKTSLDAAIAGTGQAEAGQERTYRRIGESITAMLSR